MDKLNNFLAEQEGKICKIGSREFLVRNLRREDIPQVLDLIKENKWHTGTDGIRKWHEFDKNAFKVAVTNDGQVLAVCGTVLLCEDLHFFGYYVVKEDCRGIGIGPKVWEACKEYIGERNVGLNSVSDKINLYRTREHFLVNDEDLLVQENDTMEDIITPENLRDILPNDISIEHFKEAHLPSMFEYDLKVCGFNRELLLKLNCEENESKTLVAFKNDLCVGFGTIKRSCQDIPLVSPLYADDPKVAESILKRLILSYPLKKGFYMATLYYNQEANDMIKKLGCPPTHKLSRMYRRKLTLNFCPQRVFGVFDIDLSPL